jgi:hypothetical protein
MDEFFAKRKEMMRGVVARVAWSDVQPRLVVEAKRVASGIQGAIVLEPPGPKDLGRAQEKVSEKYGGDWLKMRDMARCTVVVLHDFQINAALRSLRAHFSGARNGFQFFEEKTVKASSNDAGYSGWTINAISAGVLCEIQVNTKVLMYAKDLPQFRAAFRNQDHLMKAGYPAVAGGLGHILYEVSRDSTEPPARRIAYAKASKLYYDYFRSIPANPAMGRAAKDAIFGLGLVTH